MSFRRCVLLCCLTLGFAGCQTGLSKFTANPAPGPDPEAAALIQSGDLQGALARYERLARSGKNPDHWQLEAADTALRAGDTGYARKTVGTIDPKALSAADRDRLALLESRLDLNEGDARSAIAHLNSLTDSTLSDADQKNYRLLRASALNQLGDMKGSARERLTLGKWLTKPEDLTRNDEAIFEALGRLPAQQLEGGPRDDQDMAGWLALMRIIRATPKAEKRSALAVWRERFPSLSVSPSFLAKHLGNAAKPDPSPGPAGVPPAESRPQGPFIGVLLPLGGTYAKASEAVRLGLEAAFEADKREGKARLEFVDTSTGDLPHRLTELQQAGAVGFIGPLVKDDLTHILDIKDLHVPMIALNQVPGPSPSGLIEFGLTPETDVEQLAAEIWSEGGRAAVILIPQTPFGQRLGQHFDRIWREKGGSILGQVSFTPRGERLGEISRDLPALPKDGIILMIADPEDARAITPNLMTATQVAIWAPGKVYDGRADAPSNAALHNVGFCDMPFLLAPETGGPLSAQSLMARAPADTPDAGRLIAFGLDGYRLFTETRSGLRPDFSLEGATGILRVGQDQKVSRQLTCARFEKALPIVQGLAPNDAAASKPSPGVF
jgi:outer membrane PBP1 activator LpoA protein